MRHTVETRRSVKGLWFFVGTFDSEAEANDVAQGHRKHHDVEAIVEIYVNCVSGEIG